MTSTPADPLRIAVRTPERQLDLALPGDVPLSSVLPTLLRHGGRGLADAGAGRGGWVLRRLDGTPLDTAITLPDQGVRDGDLLRLGPADESWPDLAYDDVVATVAAASDRGPAWGPGTRASAGAWAIGVLAVVGLAAVGRDPGLAPVAGIVALVFAAGAVLAARRLGVPVVASALAATAAVYAGATVLAGRVGVGPSAGRVARIGTLVGGSAGLACLATLLVASVALAILGLRASAVLAVAVVAALGAVAAGLAATASPGAAGTAAVVSCVAVLLGAAVPILAGRLSGVVSPAAPPAAAHLVGPGTLPPVDAEALYAAVERADAVILGLLAGVAVTVGAASLVLVSGGGPMGALLAVAAGSATALRGRTYAGVGHRVAAYLGGAAGLLPGLGYAAAHAPGLALPGACAVVIVIAVAAGSRSGSPGATRLADVAEIACSAAVVPLACAVLGLYRL